MAAIDDNETEFNPRRKLCPDGSCVGIIGSDGRCTVCGQRDPGGDAPPDANDWKDEADATADDGPLGEEPADGPSGFDSKRRLCGDDTCIGVIGPDNRCTECGKPAE